MNRGVSWLGWVNLFLLAVIVYMVIGGVPSLLQWKQKQEKPPVANMWPSLNRCFSVAPQRDTKYRIFLEDAKGKETSAELEVRVVKPGTLRPVEYDRPPLAVSYFRVKEKFVLEGATCYSLEFATASAEVVTIEPAVFPAGRVMMGSFYVKPPKTTTYRITAEGQGKKVFKELTVEVP